MFCPTQEDKSGFKQLYKKNNEKNTDRMFAELKIDVREQEISKYITSFQKFCRETAFLNDVPSCAIIK